MLVLYCLLIAGAGLVLFLISALWEHDLSKRLHDQLDASAGPEADMKRLEYLQREHKIIEWVRVAGAIGLLIGLVLPMFVGK